MEKSYDDVFMVEQHSDDATSLEKNVDKDHGPIPFPNPYKVLTGFPRTRLAVFFSAASLAGAFSGLLAFAIEKMEGIGGLEGWRWIFILDGILTVVVGASLKWTLPDSPEAASWLKPEEKAFIHRRLVEDTGTKAGHTSTNDDFKWDALESALTEWKIYLAVIIYGVDSITIYGFSYSVPSIVKGLGYETWEAQLLVVPIYVLGAISTVFFSWLADRHQKRWPFIVIPYCVAAVGFIGLLSVPQPRLPSLTYVFLFTIPAGTYPPLITILAWVNNNLAPIRKRAVGMATLISVKNLNGLVGSNIFLAQEAPHYWLGYGFGLGILVAAMGSTILLKMAYSRANTQRDAMSEEEVRARYTEAELVDMGDKSPLFRYAI